MSDAASDCLLTLYSAAVAMVLVSGLEIQGIAVRIIQIPHPREKKKKKRIAHDTCIPGLKIRTVLPCRS